MATEQPKSKFNFYLLRRVMAQAKPYQGVLIASAIMAIVLAPLGTLRPWLVQVMVDEHIFKLDIKGLGTMALIFLVSLLFHAFLQYVFQYATSWLGQCVVRDLRVGIFQHITSLRLRYFDRTPVGNSITRTISDMETINTVFSQGVITMIADILTLVFVLGIMFYTSWKLTLACLLTLPFLMATSYFFQKNVKRSFQDVRTQVARMNSFLQERITGMRIVQIFNAEQQEGAKFREVNRDYTKANLDSVFYYAVFYAVVEIIAAATLGLMIWWGARGVIADEVTMGSLVAFPIYLNMLFNPIRTLADRFNTLQMGLVAADRVFALLDDPENLEQNGSFKPDKLQGEVDFDRVWFAYNEEDFVLKDVSFHINPGETLAIVGATGSGKSTIINILNRFYDIQKGAIKVDGVDIREYDLFALRRRVALVLQDVFLFAGTVLENITLRDDTITREQVINAAKMIGAHAFIERLPGGYDYQVMERGATLSMGQRQLISFVRALVFEPDILILDEATSSIDPESESVIQFAIETMIAKRTSIIIAHRLSTIRHADNILVLHKGEVQEYGPHEELLRNENGHYKQLYEMQFLQVGVLEE
ncbi:Xenobiotic-transporting ATPase [Haliscomenobacter hydrossis DSM 1100]|uniref:Xenobiotic-transporting ATPase n=2 Tax=Haliscomenobacter TaxID=2349 RepID=F4KT85_HALH1|nr:ABC transporter ATP-binding protein [Haliscomenobacter hydrossis]AEE51142.1 Xenobiotic-transporting ATPase [Haliscomenobacter hydrossis DSM 1100]